MVPFVTYIIMKILISSIRYILLKILISFVIYIYIYILKKILVSFIGYILKKILISFVRYILENILIYFIRHILKKILISFVRYILKKILISFIRYILLMILISFVRQLSMKIQAPSLDSCQYMIHCQKYPIRNLQKNSLLATLLKIQVFWDVMLCRLANSQRRSKVSWRSNFTVTKITAICQRIWRDISNMNHHELHVL